MPKTKKGSPEKAGKAIAPVRGRSAFDAVWETHGTPTELEFLEDLHKQRVQLSLEIKLEKIERRRMKTRLMESESDVDSKLKIAESRHRFVYSLCFAAAIAILPLSLVVIVLLQGFGVAGFELGQPILLALISATSFGFGAMFHRAFKKIRREN